MTYTREFSVRFQAKLPDDLPTEDSLKAIIDEANPKANPFFYWKLIEVKDTKQED